MIAATFNCHLQKFSINPCIISPKTARQPPQMQRDIDLVLFNSHKIISFSYIFYSFFFIYFSYIETKCCVSVCVLDKHIFKFLNEIKSLHWVCFCSLTFLSIQTEKKKKQNPLYFSLKSQARSFISEHSINPSQLTISRTIQSSETSM